MHLVSLRRCCCSIKSAIDQLLTLMLKLSNSHALKTIGKPLPIATRLSTFLQNGDATAKKCQIKKWIFVFVCLLEWKTKTIFEKSIKSSITYPKHSEIQKIVGTLLLSTTSYLQVYVGSSPKRFCTNGRNDDLSAILDTIDKAEEV